jgi:hypothetical protein
LIFGAYFFSRRNTVPHIERYEESRSKKTFTDICTHENVLVASEIDFKGMVTRILGSFQKNDFREQFVLRTRG